MKLLVEDLARVDVTLIARDVARAPAGAVTVVVTAAPRNAVTVLVPLTYSRPGAGGWRAWFRCPRPGCATRRRHLYFVGTALVCRVCAGATYRANRDHRLRHHEDVVRPLLAAKRREQRDHGTAHHERVVRPLLRAARHR